MSTIVVPVKLMPDRQVNSDLVATLRACNAAANHISDVAWDRRVFYKHDLHQISYGDVRLPPPPSIRVGFLTGGPAARNHGRGHEPTETTEAT